MRKDLVTVRFCVYRSLMVVSISFFSFGLSGNTHIILRPSYTILLELSRYSSMRLKVWYWICFGRFWRSCFLVGYDSASLMAFSTIRMVSSCGS